MLQKDELYFFIIVGSAIFLLIAFFLLLFVSYFLKKKNEVLLEKELLEKQFTQALLQSQVEIHEQTLQQVSRELHDNLGQIASLIKINLNTIQLSPIDKTSVLIEDTKDLARKLITDIKSLSVGLSDNHIRQFGLSKALSLDVEKLNTTEQFLSTFETEGNIPFIEVGTATILYRMVQETLNNIIKHSQATTINVVLSGDGKRLTLMIYDNGIGFDAEKINAESAGLSNMKKRAALIKAQLFIDTSIEKGTCVTIEYTP